MSGICGIVRFDGQAVEKEVIQDMIDGMLNRGKDTEGLWIKKNIGFGHKMLWTTAESLHEHQPLVSKDDKLTITADARIDNRNELLDQLGIEENKIDVVSDIDLILLSYVKWKEACVKYLIGDFAFAIWDESKKNLFCARDHLGMKPFYYYKNSDFIIFASEISAVFTHPSVQKQINKEAIECSLLFDAVPYTETYFKDIYYLKGSTYKIFDLKGNEFTKEYWNPSDNQKIRQISFDEASDELKIIYKKALESRLRSAFPLGFELSGGLDSSSVVTYANQIGINQQQYLYSLRFGSLGCDEGVYIDSVCDTVNQSSKAIRADQLDYENENSLENFYNTYPDWPLDLFFVPHMVLASEAKDDQCRVMLTGQGGDEVLQGSRLMFVDFVKQGRLIELFKQLKGSKYKKDDLLYFVLRPFVPDFIRKIKRRIFNRKETSEKKIYLRYLDKVKFNSTDFLLQSSAQTAKMIFGAEHALWSTMNAYNLYGNYNMEVRHPLFDIRLIKFRLTTPSEYFYNNSVFKYIFRDAMRGILPDIVRQRDDKANFDEIVKMQLEKEIESNKGLENIDNFKIKNVVDKQIWSMLEKYHAKRGFREAEAFLHWKLINLEYWYIKNFSI